MFMDYNQRGFKKLLLTGAGVVLGVLVVYSIYKGTRSSKEEDENAFIPVVKVEKSRIVPICRFLKLTGALSANDSVEIKSEVDAKVKKIHFSEGSVVKKGDLLIELDDSRAAAELKEAEAQYAKIRAEYIPSSQLAEKKVISQVKIGQLKAEMDSLAATIETRKVNLSKYKIYAPFTGKVGLKNISEGQYVNNGGILTKVIDSEKLVVEFKVPDINISDVYVGQSVDLAADGNDNTYQAQITAIDPESDKMLHSFNVKAEISGTDKIDFLKPGMYVKVNIGLDKCKKGIVISESAIERYGEVESVFRVSPEGKAMRTPINSGYRNNGIVEILSGITDGETVVVEGQSRVVDGRPVKIAGNNELPKK